MIQNDGHFNIEAISKHIEILEDFAVVNILSDDDDEELSSKKNKKKPSPESLEKYSRCFIAPVKLNQDGTLNYREGCVFDNQNINGKVVMSKEEMVLQFSLLFGKSVSYELDEIFRHDWRDNGPSLLNFRKI